MKKSNAKAITTSMSGMMGKGIKPSRSMVEKKHPLKKSSHGEHDPYCYQSGPKKK